MKGLKGQNTLRLTPESVGVIIEEWLARNTFGEAPKVKSVTYYCGLIECTLVEKTPDAPPALKVVP